MPGGQGSAGQSARQSARRTHRGHWENGRYVYTDGLDGIPGHHKAHLMYYLHCVCFLLEIDHDPKINRLRRYRKYHDLTPKQTDRLIALCMLLSPDRLQDKYLYLSNTLCGERSNRFYETEVADRTVNCDEAYYDVDGETKRCEKVMSIKMDWVDEYWTEPILALVKDRQRQIKMERSRTCEINSEYTQKY